MPVGQKLREEIDFLETGCFGPRAITFGPAGQILPPKNYLQGVGLILKISSKSFHSIKSYSNFLIRTDTQTDRQTHKPPSIYGWVKFFMPVFDTFHFTMFASLTPFVNFGFYDWSTISSLGQNMSKFIKIEWLIYSSLVSQCSGMH